MVHTLACGAVAALAAVAVAWGQGAAAVAAVMLIAAMYADAWWPVTNRRRTTTRPVRARPSFHAFLVRRLGTSRRPHRVLFELFVRPLAAPSFGAFWRRWNAPCAYALLYFAYRPLRRPLRPALAMYCAFLASGFFLHDCVANGGDLLHVRMVLPGMLLFAIFGALVLLSEASRIDLAGRPAWVRVVANLALLGCGFGVRYLILR